MSVLSEKLAEQKELAIFTEGDLGEALAEYVDKEENGSFERFYDKQIRETQTKLMKGGEHLDQKPCTTTEIYTDRAVQRLSCTPTELYTD